MIHKRERRGPDQARPRSARARVAEFERMRAAVAAENATAQQREAERMRAFIAAFERERSRFSAVALVEAAWPVVVPDERRPRCRRCDRRMTIARLFTGFAWRCHVGHAARTIDPIRLAQFIARQHTLPANP